MDDTDGQDAEDIPGVIAPPPLIFASVLLVTLALDWLLHMPDFGLPTNPQITVGLILALAGSGLIVAAAIQFRRAKTNLEPWKPTTRIVTTGVYSFSRNPIYFGMAIGYLGLSLLSDRLLTLAGLPIALLIIHYGVIAREERYLEAKFGEPYRAYRRRVRRWL